MCHIVIQKVKTCALLLLCLLSSICIPVLAQNNNTGAISGRVFDPDDKPLAGTKVSIRNTRNNFVWSVETQTKGNYIFQTLPPGSYRLTAYGLPRYPNVTITDIEVNNNDSSELKLPHITLGRVNLIVKILDPSGKGVPASVDAIGPKKLLSENARLGECRFLYLRDGEYKLQVRIGGRPVRTVTGIRIKFADGNEHRLCPLYYPDGPQSRSPGACSKGAVSAGLLSDSASWNGQISMMLVDGLDGQSDVDIPDDLFHQLILPGEIIQSAAGPASVIKTGDGDQQNPPQQSGQAVERQIRNDNVTGEADVVLVNIVNAVRIGNFTDSQFTALPLGGGSEMRTYDELVFLTAGVAPPPYTYGPRGPGVGLGLNTAGDFSANGMRARSNNFTVDGSDNNDPDVGGRRQGFVALVPQTLESVQSYSLATLLWQSDLGRNSGTQVNVVSRYGSDSFHGQGYAFYTDSRLNARNFFDYTGGDSRDQDKLRRTQGGFTVCGPIVRSRTHFFAGFEHVDINADTEQHFATPTLAERRFVTRATGGALPDFFGVFPYSAGVAANDNNFFYTKELGTPVGRLILGTQDFYPLPSNQPRGPFNINNYTQVLPSDGKGSILSLKVTHQFTANHWLNIRYNFTDDRRSLPSINRAIRSSVDADARTQNLSIISDNGWRSGWALQTRFSLGRTRLGFEEIPGNRFNLSAAGTDEIGFQGRRVTLPSATGVLGQLLIEPFSPVGVDVFTLPQNRTNNTFQFSESAALSIGLHALKFGGEVVHYQFDSRQDRNYRPQAIFGYAIQADGNLIDEGDPFFLFEETGKKLLPGVQLASLGAASSILQTLTAGVPVSRIRLRFTQAGLFFNNNWRIRPNFTLDFGMRYEVGSVPHEEDGLIERAFRPENLPSPGASLLDNPDRTARYGASVAAYQEILAGRERIYDADLNNFAPRLGFAWNLRGDAKTALRGGYGIYYGVVPGALVSQSRNIFPAEIPVNIDPLFLQFDVFQLNNPQLLPPLYNGNDPVRLVAENNRLGGVPSDFPALVGELFLRNQAGGGLAFTLPDKRLRTPYVQQWHLTLEREQFAGTLFSVAYVGTKGTKLTRLTTPNGGPLVTANIPVAGTSARSDNVFGIPIVVTSTRNYSNPSEMTPLTLPPERFNKSLGAYQIFENSALSNYNAMQLEARRRLAQGYIFTAAYTWSHALDDVSDVFQLAGAPILPQNSAKLWLERASANYDIRHRFSASFICELPIGSQPTSWKRRWFGGWQQALIFQAQTGQPYTLGLPYDVNRDGNMTDRPATVDGLLLFESRGPRRVSLASGTGVQEFFDLNQVTDGVVERNTLRGAGLVNLDLAISKRIQFANRHNLEFRAEIFNLFNHANFGLPIRTIGSPGFGSAVETLTPARLFQFALKYDF